MHEVPSKSGEVKGAQGNLSKIAESVDSCAKTGDDGEVDCRISMIDIIRVPTYSKVWEVSAMAEVNAFICTLYVLAFDLFYVLQKAARLCQDFERHEWMTIRKRAVASSPTSDVS
jgi:hypothetical protein